MYSLEIKTICGNAIRLLIESLKDILQDVNLIITKEGIKIGSNCPPLTIS